MKLSQRGLDLIKNFEGLRLVAYKPIPSEKYWTIGYGHYAPEVKEGPKITVEEAENLLRQDMAKFEGYVNDYCQYLHLNQNQFDALVSFTYNCGYGNLQELTKYKTLNKEAIANRLLLYTHAGGKELAGLVKRRKMEKELFEAPMDIKLFNINEEQEALEFLVEHGIINTPEYWEKALETTYNVDHLIIKFANYVKTAENR